MNHLSDSDLEVLQKYHTAVHQANRIIKRIDIVKLIAEGDDAKEIGAKVFLNYRSIGTIIQNMCHDIGARNQAHLVAIAKDLKVI